MPDLRLVLARAIRAERVRQGLTQKELAGQLGWARQVVTAIENEERAVAVHELPGICNALGRTLDELIRDANPDDRRAIGL